MDPKVHQGTQDGLGLQVPKVKLVPRDSREHKVYRVPRVFLELQAEKVPVDLKDLVDQMVYRVKVDQKDNVDQEDLKDL